MWWFRFSTHRWRSVERILRKGPPTLAPLRYPLRLGFQRVSSRNPLCWERTPLSGSVPQVSSSFPLLTVSESEPVLLFLQEHVSPSPSIFSLPFGVSVGETDFRSLCAERAGAQSPVGK